MAGLDPAIQAITKRFLRCADALRLDGRLGAGHDVCVVIVTSFRFHYEDFEPGSILRFGKREITREEIIAYAKEFDFQPFHLDEEAAKSSLLGGLAASGWHVCAILMRMCWDGFMSETASMGSPGIEEMRWMRPVRPGHILTIERTVLDKRRSSSRKEMGLVKFRFDVFSQEDERLGRMENWYMVGVREPERS